MSRPSYPFLRPRYVLHTINKYIGERRELGAWERSGKPVPPPHLVKQRVVKEYARRYSIRTLVETGTYTGAMVFATKDLFGRIFSIELNDALYQAASVGFSKFPHVTAVHGDSGYVLPEVLSAIFEPCLFWLDGHHSGGTTAKGELETPIRRELQHILNHQVEDHVVLIDDARCFVGESDYPTIEELRDMIHQRRPNWVFEVEYDIIRAHPRNGERYR